MKQQQKKKAIKSVDGLLTIGATYRWFKCKSKETCAIPFRPLNEDHCFVHEAEWRGVSRKVSDVPHWAAPGKTRVFLAYSKNHRTRIYGYFLLQRVEVLAPFPKVTSFFEQKKNEGEVKSGVCPLDVILYDADTGADINQPTIVVTDHSGINIAGASANKRGFCHYDVPIGSYTIGVSIDGYEAVSISGSCTNPSQHYTHKLFLIPVQPRKPKNPVRTEKCPDGSEIVTHKYVKGVWVKTDEKCNDFEVKCFDGAVKYGFCPDGSLIPTDVCIDNEWHPTGVGCPTLMPIDNEPFLPHRSCSKRVQPRGVYLVDALAAEIADDFSKALNKTNFGSSYQNAVSDDERQSAITQGEELFKKIVNEVQSHRRKKTKVPDNLRGKAELRGELVLFDHPPLLNIKPRPVFRSLTYIDGDHLLEQIARGENSVTVHFSTPEVPSKSSKCLTKRQISAVLAGTLNVNQALADRFLEQLYQLAREELAKGRPFRLPHLGTFRYTGKKAKKLGFTISKKLPRKMKQFPRKMVGTNQLSVGQRRS